MGILQESGWSSNCWNATQAIDGPVSGVVLRQKIAARLYICRLHIDCGGSPTTFRLTDGESGATVWQTTLPAHTTYDTVIDPPIQLTKASDLLLTTTSASRGSFVFAGGRTGM